jgi:hypothetical protein
MLNIIAGVFSEGTPPAPPNSYESIATTILGSSSSTITFSSIPQTFTHLQIRIMARPDNVSDGSLTLNGNTGTRTHQLYGTGASALAGDSASQGFIDAGGVSTSFPAVYVIDILDYKNTNKTKVVRDLFGYDANGSGRVGLCSILYNFTSAVTSLSFTGRSYAANSSFALYGIKG